MKSPGISKQQNNKSHNDSASSIDCNDYEDHNDDSEIFLDLTNTVKNAKLKNYSNKSNKNLEVVSARQLPTIFFLISIIVLAILMSKSVPQLASLSTNYSLFKDKMTLKYIPEELGDQSLAVKGLIITSQFVLALTMICLTSLIRQRISVPELIKEKWRNSVVIISSSVSIIAMISLLYYNKETLYFSQKYLGLVDNIVFLVYLAASFTYSFMTFELLSKFNIREIPKNCSCMVFKKALILLMGVQLFCYFLSLILVSFYNPFISQEKVLLSILVICMSINAIIFLMSQVMFVFSLKYDLYYVNMNLQIRPDLEYFVDLDNPNTNTNTNMFKSTL